MRQWKLKILGVLLMLGVVCQASVVVAVSPTPEVKGAYRQESHTALWSATVPAHQKVRFLLDPNHDKLGEVTGHTVKWAPDGRTFVVRTGDQSAKLRFRTVSRRPRHSSECIQIRASKRLLARNCVDVAPVKGEMSRRSIAGRYGRLTITPIRLNGADVKWRWRYRSGPDGVEFSVIMTLSSGRVLSRDSSGTGSSRVSVWRRQAWSHRGVVGFAISRDATSTVVRLIEKGRSSGSARVYAG